MKKQISTVVSDFRSTRVEASALAAGIDATMFVIVQRLRQGIYRVLVEQGESGYEEKSVYGTERG